MLCRLHARTHAPFVPRMGRCELRLLPTTPAALTARAAALAFSAAASVPSAGEPSALAIASTAERPAQRALVGDSDALRVIVSSQVGLANPCSP